jgi:predicted nucleic acid-binding Zn ribbon protein
MKGSACLKCGSLIEQPRTGRRRWFCSDACRIAASYERRRLNARLEVLETRASRLRHEPDSGLLDIAGRSHCEQLASVEAEIADAEARLRHLLEGGEK